MEVNIIFSKTPTPGIYTEDSVKKYLHEDNGKCFLLVLNNEETKQIHYLWAYNQDERLRITPLFDDDYIPQNLDGYKISILENGNFFHYKRNLYFLYQDIKKEYCVVEIDVYNTWFEAEMWGRIIGLEDVQSYIAKVYLIAGSKAEGLKPIGYCWRLYNEQYVSYAPLFKQDFSIIRQYSMSDLHFEMLERGEKIFRENEFWQVEEYEKDKFFLCQSPVKMKIYKPQL